MMDETQNAMTTDRTATALSAEQAVEKEVDAFQARAGVVLSPATVATLFHCMKRVFDWGRLSVTAASAPSPAATGEGDDDLSDDEATAWVEGLKAGLQATENDPARKRRIISTIAAPASSSDASALLAARDEYSRLMGRHVMPAREMKKHDALVREARNRLAAEAVLYCHKIAPLDLAALRDGGRSDA